MDSPDKESSSQKSRFQIILEKAAKLWRKKPLVENAAQSISETVSDPEAVKRTFERVQTMLNQSNTDTEGKHHLSITPDGGISMLASAELMQSQRNLDLTEAQVGDVVWWRDNKGFPGYFLITTPYQKGKEGSGFQYGEGIIQAESENGKLEEEKGAVEGAGFGMLWMGRIAVNMPVNLNIPKPNPKAGFYQTHSVVDMGIIKAEAIARG